MTSGFLNTLHIGVGKGFKLFGRYWSVFHRRTAYQYGTIAGQYTPSPVTLLRDLYAWRVRVFFLGWPFRSAIAYSHPLRVQRGARYYNRLLSARMQIAFIRELNQAGNYPESVISPRRIVRSAWMPLLEVADDDQVLGELSRQIADEREFSRKLRKENYDLKKQVEAVKKEEVQTK